MPPPVAALLTLGFIAFLFRRDARETPNVSRALWLPFTWMVLSGSRAVSEWLSLGGLNFGAVNLEEGSPIDRLVYLGLIAAGFYVLRQREVRLGQLIRDNRWLAAFLIYCLLAVLWSDFPFVSLKRWIKVIGHPIMALIILTEPDPEAALAAVMKRVAYILLPDSVLFIKYFPHWGRVYDAWTGAPQYTGITTNKNLLGGDCLILGFFFIWHFFKIRRLARSKARRDELFLCAFFILMTCWLLKMADSKTALVSMLLGVTILLFTEWKGLDRRSIGTYLVLGILAAISAQLIFDVYDTAIRLLGRNATLTDRTLLWEDLLKADVNPLFGAGFESFWLGERLQTLWEKFPWRPNQAHNGYLETYLNLGLIGLFMLIGLLFVTYRKARRELLTNFEMGRFRLAFLAAIIARNWTEAGFKTTGFMFFAFYIIAIDYVKPSLWRASVDATPDTFPAYHHRDLETVGEASMTSIA
jgi:exopolysaccharide production protein ExoQ